MGKKIAIVSFTPNGLKTAQRMQSTFLKPLGGIFWEVSHFHKPQNLKEWCKQQFREQDAILFIGAMGIAVRTIAPFLESKTKDPAVLVMDEHAKYVISVLSGHIGGANELTVLLAEELGANPVITTASDVNSKIAIDVFAKKNELIISDMQKAKKVAAAIVEGMPVHFSCEGTMDGRLPEELSAEYELAKYHIAVTPYESSDADVLHLIPKVFVLGIGCKKGKTAEEIENRVKEELAKYHISIHSIAEVATIDLKKTESGLLDFCKKYALPITFYTAEELREVNGDYQTSEFVSKITGVDNVCERAAMRKAETGHSQLVIKKNGKDGVTIALAKRDWRVRFE